MTGAASSLTGTSAVLNATVNPGGAEVTACSFEYGTTTSYSSRVSCSTPPGAGESPVAVSAPVTGLNASTTYHFRIVATNSGGPAFGADQTFTTAEVVKSAPEFGRCVEVPSEVVGGKTVYHGVFKAASCTKLAKKHAGRYEWDSGVLNAHFTSFEATSLTLETIKGVKVFCTGELTTGEFTSGKTVGDMVIEFTGCVPNIRSENCTSPDDAPGKITTRPLEGQLGFYKGRKKVALVLYPVGKTGPLMEFSCGSTTVSVQGSVVVPVTTGKMQLTVDLHAATKKGRQVPESFAGGPKETLEESLNGAPFEATKMTLAMALENGQDVEVDPAA